MYYDNYHNKLKFDEIFAADSDLPCPHCYKELDPYELPKIEIYEFKKSKRKAWKYSYLYTTNRRFKVKVGIFHCPYCHKQVGADCSGSYVFNYTNRTLFSHELLNRYMHEFNYGMSISSFVEIQNGIYSDNRLGYTFVDKTTFCKAFYAYASLIEFDYKFSCGLGCGDEPDAIVYDGVDIGLAKSRANSILPPPLTYLAQKWIKRNHDYNSNRYFEDPDIRLYVRRFVISVFGAFKRDKVK